MIEIYLPHYNIIHNFSGFLGHRILRIRLFKKRPNITSKNSNKADGFKLELLSYVINRVLKKI